MFRNLITVLCLGASLLSSVEAQDSVPATVEEQPADGATGFSPQAMQEWQAIEKELLVYENNPDKLLVKLDECMTRDLLEETKQLLRAIKAQVINKMLDDIFRTAETEADILKARKLITQLTDMIPDEEERKLAQAEVEQQFADPAGMLQQVLQARAEQQAAEEQAAEIEEVELTEQDYDRIAAIRAEVENINGTDKQVEYLNGLLKKESAGVCNWIRPHMTQLLLDELNGLQAAGIKTVEDVLKVKACFAKIIRYCYPENEKKQALKTLEEEFADPEAVLRMIREQEQMMMEPESGEEEPEDEEEDEPVTV
ncbi:MAG: hypothetical protein IJ503_02645 [Akkermansia sp.]|nr:hypothetical protein [Akkermansia sp.]